MPSNLHRYYGAKHLHFITCGCYHRLPVLGTARRRDLFLRVLEEARRKYQFIVVGYVVMPEHFHLLMSEPEKGDPSVVMKVVKQRFARLSRRRQRRSAGQTWLWPEAACPKVWQKRFYDFNVWSERKRVEKLRYMHRNPVQRGLVSEPEQWAWSSYRAYALGEKGQVRVNFQEWPLTLKPQPRQSFDDGGSVQTPLIRKGRE